MRCLPPILPLAPGGVGIFRCTGELPDFGGESGFLLLGPAMAACVEVKLEGVCLAQHKPSCLHNTQILCNCGVLDLRASNKIKTGTNYSWRSDLFHWPQRLPAQAPSGMLHVKCGFVRKWGTAQIQWFNITLSMNTLHFCWGRFQIFRKTSLFFSD